MYDNKSDIFGFIYNDTEYYYIKNAQNDVIAIADENGNVLVNYTYDPWGKVISITDKDGNELLQEPTVDETATTVADELITKSATVDETTKDVDTATKIAFLNPIRYRSYYYDSETEWYYLKTRYYSPDMCRFINADSVIAGSTNSLHGYNLYAYCFNNPLNFDDTIGNWPKWVKKTAKAISNTAKKVFTTVKKAIKPRATATKRTNLSSLPKKGTPGYSRTLPNPDGTSKQKRWYGPDGNAERDRDFNHPGDMPFPHDHEWKNGNRGEEHLPPDPAYEIDWEPILGLGLVFICFVGVAIIVSDDVTGIGALDDFLLGPLGTGISKGLIMIL